jgi:signal transduction histidine kinase/ligand-binding sensor domain-containing protein
MTSRDSNRGAATTLRRAALAMCALLLTTRTVLALNPALDARQYVHTAWKVRDGFAKAAITSIAQTPDGYLWLGTALGLLRFDGVRAEPWYPPPNQRLPSDTIHSLLTSSDGTLWIGTNQGLASWKDGRLTRYEALAGSFVSKLVEDRNGSIWMLRFNNRWTLCQVAKTIVTCHGEDGGDGADALGLYADQSGTLWVGTSTGLWRWTPGPPTFYRLPHESNGIQGLSDGSEGSLLISANGGIRRLVDGEASMVYPFPTSTLEGHILLRDRDGGLWAGTTTGGLVHVHEGITDVFSQLDGLSGNGVSAMLEDREGNIWVATTDGLDRFRESAVVSYSTHQGLSNGHVTSVLASADGSVWLGTYDGLNRWTNGNVTVYRERSAPRAVGSQPQTSRTAREFTGAGMPRGVQSIFEDSQRRVWLSTTRGVGYLENDHFVAVSAVPGGQTRAIVEDGRKALRIANGEAGLFRLGRDGRDVEQTSWALLKRQDLVSAVAADPSGNGLWFGFFRGGITHFAAGQVRVAYGTADGLADGRVSALYADPAGGTLWVATDSGLSRLKNGRLATMNRRNGLPCDAIGWIVEDTAGSLWLGMPCGLVRIARSDINAWAALAENGDDGRASTHRVQATLFDHADGVRMYVNASYYTAPAARSSDGKLWFMSYEGVSVVDPARLPVNSLPPPVSIEQVIADRQIYDRTSAGGGSLRLPPLTRDLQIEYTALSLVAPEKMQFRYKLEGWDRHWQDVGNRRQAFYANLPPRHYRFRVIASNNSGVWNDTGATLDFTVAPAYYQTAWFPALIGGVALAVVWGAHRVRLRIVEKHEREISALNERLMKAQEQERIRIAGELHDGVMQQMLAVTMMLGTAKRRTGESETKTSLDKIQEKLIQTGTDIRQLSHDLHPPILQEAGLPDAVRNYCEQFSASSGIGVSCDADHGVRDLSRGAALALFRIVQEALGNAAKHAHATQVTVRLTRSADEVSLTVSDDGAGFDANRLAASGGLGLVMMRERASQLNGRFEFDSAPGRGTTIRVVIPFR